MFEGILTAVELILVAVFFGLPVGFVLRMLGCLNFAGSRKKVRDWPILHTLWLIASIMQIAYLCHVMGHLPKHSEAHECRSKIEMIRVAMQQFHKLYDRFPLQSEPMDHPYVSDQARLIRILRGTENNLKEDPAISVFLEVNDKDKGDRGMLDPWENPMHIVADWSGDGRVSVGANVLHEKVAVWSDGPNGKNEFGSGDDITSW